MYLTTLVVIFIVTITARDTFTGSVSPPETDGQVSGDRSRSYCLPLGLRRSDLSSSSLSSSSSSSSFLFSDMNSTRNTMKEM